MTDPGKLSRRERQIMDVVYAKGDCSVNDVLDGLDDAPTRTSVRTTLRILEEKGFLRHRESGREYIYRPVQSRKRAASQAFKRVLNTFFEGSLADAVAVHLSNRRISDEELQHLQNLIQEAREQGEQA